MPYGLRPGEWDALQRAQLAGQEDDETDSETDVDEERQAIIKAIARHTEHTVSELEELTDEELADLVAKLQDEAEGRLAEALEELTIDALNVRLAGLAAQADRLAAAGADRESDVDVYVDGHFTTQDSADDSDETDDGFRVGGYFTNQDAEAD